MTMQTDDLKPDTPRNLGDHSAPHMSPITPAEDIRTVMLNRVSGSAVLIGTAMMLASQLILNLFGVGIGAAYAGSASANAAANGMATLSLGALLWWTFSGIVSAFIGGLAAGRLAGKPKESSAGWHGLGSWAVSVVVVAFLMAAGLGTVASSFRINAASPTAQTNGVAYNNNGNVSAPTNTSGEIGNSTGGGSTTNTYGPPANGASTSGANNMANASPNANAGGTANGTAVQANNAPAATAANNAMNVDPRTAARLSIISAIGLLLGAIAAWFGGWSGAVEPTVTDPLLRTTGSSFHSF